MDNLIEVFVFNNHYEVSDAVSDGHIPRDLDHMAKVHQSGLVYVHYKLNGAWKASLMTKEALKDKAMVSRTIKELLLEIDYGIPQPI